MNYREIFIELLRSFFSGSIDRAELSHQTAIQIPIDANYEADSDLMKNCEWALRHANEDDLWTTESELKYYYDCLTGYKVYSEEERNKSLGK